MLRSMLAQDIECVARVERTVVEFPWPRSQFENSLTDGHDCTVLQIDNDVLGFSIFSRVLDESTLLNIAVCPELQGQGYGRKLLEHGLVNLYDDGIQQCFLEVRCFNVNAKALYQAVGFSVVGERKQYYPAHKGREDALVMSCCLGDRARVIV